MVGNIVSTIRSLFRPVVRFDDLGEGMYHCMEYKLEIRDIGPIREAVIRFVRRKDPSVLGFHVEQEENGPLLMMCIQGLVGEGRLRHLTFLTSEDRTYFFLYTDDVLPAVLENFMKTFESRRKKKK